MSREREAARAAHAAALAVLDSAPTGTAQADAMAVALAAMAWSTAYVRALAQGAGENTPRFHGAPTCEADESIRRNGGGA